MAGYVTSLVSPFSSSWAPQFPFVQVSGTWALFLFCAYLILSVAWRWAAALWQWCSMMLLSLTSQTAKTGVSCKFDGRLHCCSRHWGNANRKKKRKSVKVGPVLCVRWNMHTLHFKADIVVCLMLLPQWWGRNGFVNEVRGGLWVNKLPGSGWELIRGVLTIR